MTFKADPDAIRACGSGMSQLAGDAGQAGSYATTWLGIGYAEGRMSVPIVEQATAVRQALEENYARLAERVTAAGTDLVKAADFYQHADEQELRRLDTIYERE